MKRTKSDPGSIMVLAWLMAASFAGAGELYVSPTGAPDGDGSKAKPLGILVAISDKSPAKPGDTLYLLAGTYNGPMTQDVNRVPQRLPFEVKVSGAPDKPIRILPAPGAAAHLNGSVAFNASYVHLIGLDIGDLQWDPWGEKHKTQTALNATSGKSMKVINCNIFGGAMGTGAWQPAVNLEFYGNLIHDFGGMYRDKKDPTKHNGRGHGHAYYAQNLDGTKIFQHNIAYRGCGWNVHIYTQEANITGFDVIENISYIAGTYVDGQTTDNYLACGWKPADRIRMNGNVGYQPTMAAAWRANTRLITLYKPLTNGTGEVCDNYFAGAAYGLSLGAWKSFKVTGNTFWALKYHVEISSVPTGSAIPTQDQRPTPGNYQVDNNTYIANGNDLSFVYGLQERPGTNDIISFAAWQKLGFDKNSRMVPGKDGKPAENKTFVFPNKYAKGRANVGIFNWEGKDKVEVDLSGALAQGQKYAIYNCLDIKQTIGQAKPVLNGSFDGKPVAFPLRKDKLSPDFDAFLVAPELN